jgi:hypothetical protein
MSLPLPTPCSKQQWTSFRELGINSYRHQKVVVSNLGLTVSVKHLVKLVKQVPQPALRERKKKQLKGRDIRSSLFLPLTRAKAFRHSLSFHKKHIYLTQYIGGKSLFHQESPSLPLQGFSHWPCKPSGLL